MSKGYQKEEEISMRLSIITITYNNAEGLERTLTSVASQMCHEIEHVIVDGGSKDGSVEIIKEYVNQCLMYDVLWVSEPDKGVYDAMNKGIKKAHGEYCLFLNAGDVLYGDSAIEELMANNPNADIVSCNAIEEGSQYHKEKFIISPDAIKASDVILGYLPHQATLIRRKLFEQIHYYSTSYKVVSDWQFFIEALLKYNASYQHIQMFLSSCESDGISSKPENQQLMEDEFHKALKEALPLFYEDYVDLRKKRFDQNSEPQQFIQKFFASQMGRLIWKIRNRLKKKGYYEAKRKSTQRKLFKQLQKEDDALKRDVAAKIEALPENMLHRKNDATDVIVSLTSYGKRVEDAAPYAIYSIFAQSVLPNRIVLWLDKDNWDDDNLPYLLKRLKKAGLEIYYCEDIRSYKKLIPSLKMFPDNPIVVMDDDFYYNVDFVKWMVECYEQSDKRTVFATWGCIPVKENGKYIPYTQWKDCKYGNAQTEYSLFGGGSIYPPHIFDEDVTNEKLFMELCPSADDIWLWAQEKRLGIKTQLSERNGYGLHRPVNRIESYDLSQIGTLFYENCIQGKNDKQLFAVLNHYKLQG